MSIKLPGLHTGLATQGTIFSVHARPRVFTPPIPNSPAEPRRRRIWELTGNFHCSIIGTCLTTAELRHILTKILPGASKETDHELHGALFCWQASATSARSSCRRPSTVATALP